MSDVPSMDDEFKGILAGLTEWRPGDPAAPAGPVRPCQCSRCQSPGWAAVEHRGPWTVQAAAPGNPFAALLSEQLATLPDAPHVVEG